MGDVCMSSLNILPRVVKDTPYTRAFMRLDRAREKKGANSRVRSDPCFFAQRTQIQNLDENMHTMILIDDCFASVSPLFTIDDTRVV